MHERPHEGVLRHLLGASRVARHHQRQPEQPWLVEHDQPLERLTVAAPDRLDSVARGTFAILAHARRFGGSPSSTSPSPIEAQTSFRAP